VLTDRERRALAEIESAAAADDPGFAARLSGSPRGRWSARLRVGLAAASSAAVPGGLAVTLLTFARSPIAGFSGVALSFLGLAAHEERIAAWGAGALSRVGRRR
jgi:hypothetical protein